MATASIKWFFSQFDLNNGNTYYGNQTFAGNTEQINQGSSSVYGDTRYQCATRYVEMGSTTPSNLFANQSGIFSVSGCVSGGALIPQGVSSGDRVSGGFINLPGGTNQFFVQLRLSGDLPNGIDSISENGQYYKDNDGNWRKVSDDNIVATASQVQNLPAGVEFNGWAIDNEIIKGSDGSYYNTDGAEMFQNLPSGVIPTSSIVPSVSDGQGGVSGGIYEGSDGKYYAGNGSEILSHLPTGVIPSSQIGDVVVGSDGHYYDIDGYPVMSQLPSGVTIVDFDPTDNTYEGSDGNKYDIDGNEVEEPSESCDGTLLSYNNTVRLTIDCIDIFGNQRNIGADITVGQLSLDISTLFNIDYIRQINRITARTLGNQDESCGSGQLIVRAPVVGARVAVDVEGVDIDVVLGNYTVCTCIFEVCDRYADIALNPDLPLGLANSSALDVGYYCLNQFLYFEWTGFNDVFPYCCPSFNTNSKESGSTPSPVEDKDIGKLVDSIDKLTEAVKDLSTLVEVVVTPAEDVNIYNRRFHYNDRDNVSGFSE